MQIRGKGPPGGLPASLGGPGPPSQSRGGAAVPPPQLIYAPKPVGLTKAATDLSKSGFSRESSLGDASLSYSQYGVAIKRQRTEDEYFNSDDEVEDIAKLEEETPAYQPAPGSPSYKVSQFAFLKTFLHFAILLSFQEEEEDELDAYMKALEKEAATKGVTASGAPGVAEPKKEEKKDGFKVVGGKTLLKTGMIMKKPMTELKNQRVDVEQEDEEESYYRYMEENPNAGKVVDDDDILAGIDYDDDGNPIAPVNSKNIDPLEALDHSKVEYEKFVKNFYEEHPDISGLNKIQQLDLLQKLNVKVSGPSPPKPVCSFGHFGFDKQLMKAITKSEFTEPTPIQAVACPAVLSGRDVLGTAQTGSGKTCAFIWPMLVHCMDQRELRRGDGPIALILVPTRELALQIYSEVKRYAKVYNLTCVCAYGGGNKYEQSKVFEQGAEIAIATPGRMIDMIKMKVTNLTRVTYLVLDEADRMFDMGFEPQVRSICDHVRPDRQCQLYSATFKKRIEKLARDVLTDPVRVAQGDLGSASELVTQVVKVVPLGGYKWQWLVKNLVQFMSEGSVIIFVTKKQNCEELAHNLKVKAEINCRCLQGDMFQNERNEIISAFKRQEFPILVATDVAARGLDIAHVRNVINFDLARDIDTHTHRIGRTGRAGVQGTAHTLVTENDLEFAGHIVRSLESSNQEVPKELMDLALKSSWFSNSR